MRNRIDLRSSLGVRLVHQRVRKPVEVVNAEAEVTEGSTVGILDHQIPNTLELREESFGN